MPETEPEITEIASYIASRIPTEGVDNGKAVDAWRHALRYARRTGTIEELADEVSKAEPENAQLQLLCAEVSS